LAEFLRREKGKIKKNKSDEHRLNKFKNLKNYYGKELFKNNSFAKYYL